MWQGSVGLIVGILIGGFGAWMWVSGRVGKTESVESLKRDNQRFRDEVNDHFVQTAELINQLTDSYKAVFDHLSVGAETLVEPEAVRERMPQVGDEVVRLKRLGAPMASASAEPQTQAAEPEADPAELSEAAETSEKEAAERSAAAAKAEEHAAAEREAAEKAAAEKESAQIVAAQKEAAEKEADEALDSADRYADASESARPR